MVVAVGRVGVGVAVSLLFVAASLVATAPGLVLHARAHAATASGLNEALDKALQEAYDKGFREGQQASSSGSDSCDATCQCADHGREDGNIAVVAQGHEHIQIGSTRYLWPTVLSNTTLPATTTAKYLSSVTDLITTKYSQELLSSKASSTMSVASVTGWSSSDLLEWRDKGVRQLEKDVLAQFKALIVGGETASGDSATKTRTHVMLSMTAHVLRPNDFRPPVFYSDSLSAHYTAVIILSPGVRASTITFSGGSACARMHWQPREYTHTIAVGQRNDDSADGRRVGDAGRMFLFPASLMHYVSPSSPAEENTASSSSLRIIATANLKIVSEVGTDGADNELVCVNCPKKLTV